MKKRSLVAAVAMLIVSAIVLTSATYAWFVVGTDASIKTFTAQAKAASSGVQLRVYDEHLGWTSEVTYSDLTADTTNNSFPAAGGKLAPATCYVDTNNALVKKAGEYDSTGKIKVSDTTTAGTDYIHFKVKIRRTDADGSVWMTPSIGTHTGSTDANKGFKVAVAYTGSSAQGVVGVWGDAAYSAINTANATGYSDTNDDKIYATGDTGFDDTKVTAVPAATGAFELANIQTEGTSEVEVWIWIEGNDPDCTNALANQIADIGLTFTTTAPAVGG